MKNDILAAGAYFSLVGSQYSHGCTYILHYILHRMGRDLFRHGDETLWTPGDTVLDTGKAVDFRSVYLFMRRLAFGISIHGRRYVCTYIESICWYLYYFTIFRVGDSDSIFGHSNAVPHCFLRVCF